jgi:hypothetical protein
MTAPAIEPSGEVTAVLADATPPTAKSPHGHIAKSLKLLDELRPWDVYTGPPTYNNMSRNMLWHNIIRLP